MQKKDHLDQFQCGFECLFIEFLLAFLLKVALRIHRILWDATQVDTASNFYTVA